MYGMPINNMLVSIPHIHPRACEIRHFKRAVLKWDILSGCINPPEPNDLVGWLAFQRNAGEKAPVDGHESIGETQHRWQATKPRHIIGGELTPLLGMLWRYLDGVYVRGISFLAVLMAEPPQDLFLVIAKDTFGAEPSDIANNARWIRPLVDEVSKEDKPVPAFVCL